MLSLNESIAIVWSIFFKFCIGVTSSKQTLRIELYENRRINFGFAWIQINSKLLSKYYKYEQKEMHDLNVIRVPNDLLNYYRCNLFK